MISFYISLLILTVAFSSIMVGYGWRHRPSPGAGAFALLMVSLSIWAFAYIFEILGVTLETKLLSLKIEYIGIVGLPTFWLILTTQFSGNGRWLTKRNLSLLAIEPLAILLLVWTSSYHNWYYSSIELISIGDFAVLDLEYQPLFWVHAAYSYLLLLVGGVLLIQTYLGKYRSNNKQLAVLLIALLLPWMGNAIYLFRLGSQPHLDLTPVFFALSSPILAWRVFRLQLMDLLPVAYDTLVKSMNDGLLVLDKKNRIVFLNPEVEKIIGLTATEVRGQPAERCLPPHLPLPGPDVHGTYGELSTLSTQGRQYYELQASPLHKRRRKETGKLIVFRNITHHKIAEKSLRRRAEELSTLNATLLDIATSQNITVLMQTVVRRAVHLLNAQGGALFMLNGRQNNLRCMASYKYPKEINGQVIQLGRGAAGLVAKTGSPLLIPDYRKWNRHQPSESEVHQIIGLVSVPLAWRKTVLGVLHVFDIIEERRFSEDDLEMLTLFSNQAAIALENARLFEEEQRRTREAETLRQSAAALAATLDQEEAIEGILEQLGHVVPFDSASVQLLQKGRLEIVGGRGLPNPKATIGIRFSIPGANPNTRVIQSGKPVIIENLDGFPGFSKKPGHRIRSWLGVPIIFHDEVIGMLSLDSYKKSFYRHEHARLATSFADQVAVAIQNARLYTQVEQRAEELGRLFEAASDMAASLEPDVILEGLARHLTQAVEATSGRVLEVDQEAGFTKLLAVHTCPGATEEERSQHLGRIEPIKDFPSILNAFERGAALSFHTDDLSLSHPERQELSVHGVKSSLLVPIVSRGRLLGQASIWESRRRRKFSAAEKRLAQALAQHGAGVIENARLYADIRQHANELDALRATLTDLSSELELSRLLQAIIERAASLLGATGGDLGIFDPNLNKLKIVVSYNMGCDYTGVIMNLGEGAMGVAAETLQPLIVRDYQVWEGRSPQYQNAPWLTVLAAPMLIGGKLVGALGLVDEDPRRVFTVFDQHLLTLFAQQAAMAIRNARLYASAVDASKRWETLHHLSQEIIAARLEPEAIYSAVHRAAVRIMPAEAFVIAFLEESLSSIKAVYVVDKGGRGAPFSFPVDKGVSGHVIRTKQSLIVEDWLEFKEIEALGNQEEIRSLLAVPVRLGGKITGMLSAQSYEPYAYTDEDCEILEMLAAYAGIALDNAGLFNEIQQMAMTDPLTGLHNRRQLFRLGQKEFKRSLRFKRPMAVIMLDLDNFKNVNDTFGHTLGDRILVVLAERLRKQTRDHDIVARYGGDEFILIMPETNQESAIAIAERLREYIVKTPIPTEAGDVCLSISIGVAALTKETSNFDALLVSADHALYGAKHTGRNRVEAR
jgi:diguanylate cyclase (GGDEF)-like protein/PAS domain S-box-containing protein